MFRLRDPVWAVPAAALGLRLLLFAAAAPHAERFTSQSDSREYVTLANNLALGHGFSQAEQPPYEPDVRRTPLYPSVLAALFTIGSDIRVAAIANIAVSVATVAAVIALTTRLFGAAAGPAAGLLLALDVTSAAYATQALTEPLFTLLLVLALLAVSDPGGSDALRGVSSGALTGMAALCRPIGILLSLTLYPVCRWRARTNGGRGLLVCVMAIAVSAIPIAAWTLRNARVSGVATFTSQIATNTYFHRASYVAAELDGRPVEMVRDQWTREFEAASGGWTEAQRIQWMQDHGRALVMAHPLTYALVVVKGIGRMLGPDKDVLPAVLGVQSSSAAWRIIDGVSWVQLVALYACAIYGIWIAWPHTRTALLIPVSVLAYFLVLSGPEMYARFRVPLMPSLCMLAGVGLSRGRHR